MAEVTAPTSNLKRLHENLSQKDGFTVPFDQFSKDMQDENKLKRLHDNLSQKDGFTVPYDKFKADMGFSQPAQEETIDYGPFDATTSATNQNLQRYLAERDSVDKFKANPRAAMGMSVDEARSAAEQSIPEQEEPGNGFSGFGKELGNRAERGAVNLNKMLANTPNTVMRVLNAPFNAFYKAVGLPEVDPQSFNKLTGIDDYNKRYDAQSKMLTEKIKEVNPKAEQGILESAQKGDWTTFTRNLAGGVADSFAPSLAMMVGGASMKAGQMIGSGALVFGTGKLDEIDQKAPEMPENMKLLAAGANGALEGIFETYLGSGAVGGAMKKLVLREGKEAGKKTIKEGLKEGFSKVLSDYPALAPLGEGFEEWGTQVAQNYVDKITGYTPDIGIFDGATDALLIGIASGASHAAPLQLTKGVMDLTGQEQEGPVNPTDSPQVPEISPEDQLNFRIQEAQNAIQQSANPDMDALVSFTMQGSEQTLRMTGGKLSMREDGTIDRENSSKEVYYVDENGETKVNSIEFVGEVVENMPLQEALSLASQRMQDEFQAMQENAAVRPYEPGETVTVDMGDGVTFTGEIAAANEQGYTIADAESGQTVEVEPRQIVNQDNIKGVDNGSQVDYLDEQGNTQTGIVNDAHGLRNQGMFDIDGEVVPIENVLGLTGQVSTQQPTLQENQEVTSNGASENQNIQQPIQQPIITETIGNQAYDFTENEDGSLNFVPNDKLTTEKALGQLEKAFANNPGWEVVAEKEQVTVPATSRFEQPTQQTVIKNIQVRAKSDQNDTTAPSGDKETSAIDPNLQQQVQEETEPSYQFNGQEIDRETAQGLIEVAALKGNPDKLAGLTLNNDPELTKLMQEAFPEKKPSYKLSNKNITPAQAKAAILVAENMYELNQVKIANDSQFDELIAAKQAEIKAVDDQALAEENSRKNKLADMVKSYNNSTPAKRRTINTAPIVQLASELGYNARMDKGELSVTKDGVKLTKTGERTPADEIQAHRSLEEYDVPVQELAGQILIPVNAEGVKFGTLRPKEVAQAILDIQAGKKTVGANQLLDAVEKISQSGVVVMKGDRKTGMPDVEVPIADYIASINNDLTDQELELASRIPDNVATAINEPLTAEELDQYEKLIPIIYGNEQETTDTGTSTSLPESEESRTEEEIGPEVPAEEIDNNLNQESDKSADSNDVQPDNQQIENAPQVNSSQKTQLDNEEPETINQDSGRNADQAEDTKTEDQGQGISEGPAKEERNDVETSQQQIAFNGDFKALADKVVANNEINNEEAKVNTEPSEAQKEAGNYQKGHVKIHGMDIAIEQPKGSTRSGVDEAGKQWSQVMNNSYGYFNRTKGKDGDQIDVFIGDNPLSERVFVIDQNNQDGSFDEHKVMLGFNTLEEAQGAYLSNYEDGWQGLGAITETSIADFKQWAGDGTRKMKPFKEDSAIQEDLTTENVSFIARDGSEREGTVLSRKDGKVKIEAKDGKVHNVPEGDVSVKEVEDAGELNAKEGQKEESINDTKKYNLPESFIPESFSEFQIALASGQVGLNEFKKAYEVLRNSKEEFLAELKKKTKAKLLKGMNGMGLYRYKNEKKDAIIRALWSDHLMTFTFGTISYDPFAGKIEDAIDRKVANTTQTDIDSYVEENQRRRDEYVARVKELNKALDNPETLGEFNIFIKRKGLDKLSPEQRAKYDELVTDKVLEERAKDVEKGAVVEKVELDEVEMSLVETKHTQKGHDLFVVRLSDRIPREQYQELNKKAKQLGGYYSAYSRNGAIPGFQFKSKEQANQFMGLKEQDASTIGLKEEKQEVKTEKNISKLRENANKIIERADAELGQNRLTNTARRAAQASSTEARLNKEKRIAETMLNIAVAIENGDVKLLDGIKAKTHIELLDSLINQAKYREIQDKYKDEGYDQRKSREGEPATVETVEYARDNFFPNIYADHIKRLVAKVENTPGIKLIAARWNKKMAGIRNQGYYQTSGQREIDELNEMLNALPANEKNYHPIANDLINYNRLKSIGIENDSMLRAALREYVQYRGKTQEVNKVKQLERALVGRKNIGIDFFPTPKETAQLMIDEADISEGMDVLEPSAGNGNIADAITEAGVQPDVIELSSALREILEAKGYNVVANDFTEYSGKQYDRIVMNPPFQNGMDGDHVRHAYDLLKPDGKLVAIIGEGTFIRSDKKATAFREWLDSVGGTEERLETGTFKDRTLLNTTGANARLVVIEKDANISFKNRPLPNESIEETAKRSVAYYAVKDAADKLSDGLNTPVKVIATRADLSGDIQNKIKRERVGTVYGVYDNSDGSVYLVADEINGDIQLATETVLHEVVGHKGLRGLLGNRFNEVLDLVYKGMPEDVRREYVSQYGNRPRIIADEYLADMAELDASPSLFQKAIAKIRELIRKLFPDLKFNNSDVVDLLARSKKRLEKNRESKMLDDVIEDAKGQVRAKASKPNTMLIDGVERPITNSTGKPIHPTEEGIRNFWKWFGDSKVVDSEGRPLVVYHGTTKDFDEFDNIHDTYYFTDNATYAAEMIGGMPDRINMLFNQNILPVYLKSERLHKADFDINSNSIGKFQNNWDNLGKYDGVVGIDSDSKETAYVVFSPSQIKSATGNEGGFDPDNNDIRFKSAGEGKSGRSGAVRSGILEDILQEYIDKAKADVAASRKNGMTDREASLKATMEKTPNVKKTHYAHTLIKRKINDLKQGYKMGAQDMKANLHAIQSEIIAYAKKNMPLDGAGKRDVGNLLTMVRDAKDIEAIEKAFDRINEMTTGITQNANIKAIDRLLKENKPKKVNGRVQGTLNPDIYLVLDRIREIRRLSGAKEIEDFIDSIDENDTESITLFATFGNLNEKNSQEIEEALSKLREVVEEGKVWYKDQIEKRRQYLSELRKKVVNKITAGRGLISEQDLRSSGMVSKRGKLSEYLFQNKSFEWILDAISMDKAEETGEGWMQIYFGDLVNQSTNEETAGIRNAIELINEKASEIFGVSKRKLAKVMAENSIPTKDSGVTYMRPDGIRVELELSQNEAYKKWMEMQDPTLGPTFEKMGWDDITVDQLNVFIKPNVKRWAEWQLNEFYPEYFKGVNEKFRQTYFANLPFNDKYSPIKREVTEITDADDSMLSKKRILHGVGNASLKSRISNVNHLQLMDGDQILAKHIGEMEHFKAWVNTMKELRSVFGSRSVQHILKYEHGNGVRKVLNSQIDDFASGGNDRSDVINTVDRIRRAFVTAELGLNYGLFPKQLVSVLAYMSEMPIKDYATGMMNLVFNFKSALDLMRESELVKNRYQQGWTHEVHSALKSNIPTKLSGTKSLMNDIRNFLMLPTRAGDYAGVLGGWTVYRYHYKKQIADGKSEEEAHTYALNRFERSDSRTQQSAALKDSSELQKGSWGKYFTMFKNSQQQYSRYETAAIQNLIKGRGSKARNIKIIALYHVVLPVAFQLVSNLFSDDDDETENKRLLRAAIMGSANGLLIASDILEFLLEKAMGERWTYSATPIEGSVNNIGYGMANLSAGIKDMDREQIIRGLDQLAYGINNMTIGLPYRPSKKLYKKLDKAFGGVNSSFNEIDDHLRDTDKEIQRYLKDVKSGKLSIKEHAESINSIPEKDRTMLNYTGSIVKSVKQSENKLKDIKGENKDNAKEAIKILKKLVIDMNRVIEDKYSDRDKLSLREQQSLKKEIDRLTAQATSDLRKQQRN